MEEVEYRNLKWHLHVGISGGKKDSDFILEYDQNLGHKSVVD